MVQTNCSAFRRTKTLKLKCSLPMNAISLLRLKIFGMRFITKAKWKNQSKKRYTCNINTETRRSMMLILMSRSFGTVKYITNKRFKGMKTEENKRTNNTFRYSSVLYLFLLLFIWHAEIKMMILLILCNVHRIDDAKFL